MGVKPWRSAFSVAELAEIDAAPSGSVVERMARLLDRLTPVIPERGQLTQLDRLQLQQLGQIRRLEEGA